MAALRLDDIDWRAGELVIRGKGRREERMPLPTDVGEALAGWLRRGRPRLADASVFTRVHAPVGALSAGAVSHVVKSAAKRAGLSGVNAHRLRHTAATQMLRAGANLTEVGHVLRQRSLLATAIYAEGRPRGPPHSRSAVARSAGMTELQQILEDYLTIRRSLGFKLGRAEKLLNQFLAHMNHVGATIVTIDVAVQWATQPPNGTSGWRAHRLSVVRSFARHLHAIDPAHQVPPTDLLGGRSRRATPYPYSPEDIVALMTAARSLRRFPLRAATFETLVGLLAATGLRVGEAIRLNRADIDWRDGLLTVANTKFNKTRLVPLHPTTVEALRSYDRRRDELCPRPVDPSFFVSTAERDCATTACTGPG